MGKSRKKQPETQGQGLSDRELRRYVMLLIIPFILFLMVIVVLVSGRFRSSEPDETVTAETSKDEDSAENTDIPVIEPDTKEYFHDFGTSILSQDTVPEINQLMEQYFLATSECDMATFLHLFTSQDTSEEERFRQEFEKQKEYIESYQNISCYTTPGPEADSYAVYVYYEIKYREVETLAPSLVSVYAVKEEDGQYRIFDETMTPEEEEFFDLLSRNEDVRLLIAQVDQKTAQAMESDAALRERIEYMKHGPDYMQQEEQQEEQQQEPS